MRGAQAPSSCFHCSFSSSNIPTFKVVVGKTAVPLSDESVDVSELFAELVSCEPTKKTKKAKTRLPLSAAAEEVVEGEKEVRREEAAHKEEDATHQTGGKNKKRRRAK